MGRFEYIDRDNQIDRFYPQEEKLAYYINNFIYEHYHIEGQLKFDKYKHSALYAPILAKQLHSTYYDEKGNLLDEKIDNDEKKYSFLLGVYLRYGAQLEGAIYKIQIINSPKDKQLYNILKDLECDKIVYKYLRGFIPSSHFFYFAATPKMIQYFNKIDNLNKELNEHKKKMYDEIYIGKKGNIVKQRITSNEQKLIESLKIIFK